MKSPTHYLNTETDDDQMGEAPPPLALRHKAALGDPMGRRQDVHRTSSTLQLPGSAGLFFHEPLSHGDTSLQSSTATPSLPARSSFTPVNDNILGTFQCENPSDIKGSHPLHWDYDTFDKDSFAIMPSHTSQWDPTALTSTFLDTVSDQTYDTARSSLRMSPLTEMSSTNDLSYLEDSQSRLKHYNAIAERSVPYASGHTAPWDPYTLSF